MRKASSRWLPTVALPRDAGSAVRTRNCCAERQGCPGRYRPGVADLSVWIDISACQSRLTGVEQRELTATLKSDDPAVGLRAVGALHRLAEQIEARSVRVARERGWSWEQIGDALGVSRQSIHAKYGKREQ